MADSQRTLSAPKSTSDGDTGLFGPSPDCGQTTFSPALRVSFPTSDEAHTARMTFETRANFEADPNLDAELTFELTSIDGNHELVNADGYAQEGPLTTFFTVEPGRSARLDPWSVRVLSVRTDRILTVRRIEPVDSFRLRAAS